jgi:hypothetical protein
MALVTYGGEQVTYNGEDVTYGGVDVSLNETITGNGVSSTYTPSTILTDVVVDDNGRGNIYLECQAPNGEWIGVSSRIGAYSVNTPDSSILYRFRADEVQDSVHIYMGP